MPNTLPGGGGGLSNTIQQKEQILPGFSLNHNPEAEFLEEIQTKVLRLFLLAIHSHNYRFEISSSSNSRNLLQFLQFSYRTL